MKIEYTTKLNYKLCNQALRLYSPKNMKPVKSNKSDYCFKGYWYMCSSKSHINLTDSNPVNIQFKHKWGFTEIGMRVMLILVVVAYYSAMLLFFGNIDSGDNTFEVVVVINILLLTIADFIDIYRVDKFIKETLGGVRCKKQ